MDLDANTFSYMDLSCLGDAFRIDDLSDISNEDIAGPIPNDGAIAFVESASCSSSVKGNADINAPDVQFPPLEEEIGLEWLSDFVQDSFADTAANRDEHKQIQTHVESKHCSEQKGTVAQDQTLKMVIPCRARSKRSRIRVWPSEPGDVSRMLEQARASWPPDCAPVPSPPHPYDQADKRARKKQVMAGGAQPRRCSHCQSQKTPQWRAGPLGPKSLCNACGVRYKSGRLLPEYRPAKSPTFVSYKHSNSHKKVLEMRRSSQSSFC